MTTNELTPTSKLLLVIATFFERKARAKATKVARKTVSLQRTAIKILCELSGLGWLTFGAFSLNLIVGCVMAGLSCFYLAWRFDESDSNSPNETVYRG